jgi:hypothetical protein
VIVVGTWLVLPLLALPRLRLPWTLVLLLVVPAVMGAGILIVAIKSRTMPQRPSVDDARGMQI